MKELCHRLVVCSLIFFFNFSYGQYTGNVIKIPIQSKVLNQEREILVYTPRDYEESIYRYYDVIFVFDAQNRELFDLTHSLISLLDEDDLEKPFIVVGIQAYGGKKPYSRNEDFVPYPKHDEISNRLYGFGKPNIEGFSKYLREEVISLLEKKYRLSQRKLAIGHSLSASFVLSDLISDNSLFSAYMAFSPNFAYDKRRLANEFMSFDFGSSLSEEKFLYLSHANEATLWKDWKESRELIYNFLNNQKPKNLVYKIEGFDKLGHRTSFVNTIQDGLKAYKKYLKSLPINKYEVEIIVKVPNKSDEVYITGNQEVLGNGEEGKIKMNYLSPLERKITLTLKNNTRIRFTNGNENQNKVADIKNYDLPWLYEIPVSTKKVRKLYFNIIKWTDNPE